MPIHITKKITLFSCLYFWLMHGPNYVRPEHMAICHRDYSGSDILMIITIFGQVNKNKIVSISTTTWLSPSQPSRRKLFQNNVTL